MPSIAYINGRYVSRSNAFISIDDRGYQYAESIYESIAIFDHKLIDWNEHIERLMKGIEYCFGRKLYITEKALLLIVKELMRLNRCHNGICYIQVSGGEEAPRSLVAKNSGKLSVVITITPVDFKPFPVNLHTIKVITAKDRRHNMRMFKSTNLLTSILTKKQAIEQNTDDVWFYDNDQARLIHEGSANNVWIVTDDDTILTSPDNGTIINGVTRGRLINLIIKNNLKFKEASFSLEQAYNAKEAFSSGSISLIRSVAKIDQKTIGNGSVGKITQKIANLYYEYISNVVCPLQQIKKISIN